MWEPTPHESPIHKGAQTLKEPNPFENQSLQELNYEESPIFEGVKILLEPTLCCNSIFVETLQEPNP